MTVKNHKLGGRVVLIIKRQNDIRCVLIVFVALAVFVVFHWFAYNRAENDAEIVNMFLDSGIYYGGDSGLDRETHSVDSIEGETEWFIDGYING